MLASSTHSIKKEANQLLHHHIYTEPFSVTLSWHCLRPNYHKIWRVGGPSDQRGWKISKLWLPWQLLPWHPKNLSRAHKTPKRLWNFIRWALGGTRIVVMDFCYHGNQKVPWDSQNSTNWQCCNPTNKALGQGASSRYISNIMQMQKCVFQ